MSSLISSNKINARHFHPKKCFIDHFCGIYDGAEFGKSVCDMYPKELELKVKHQAGHATFLNLDICIKEGTFMYKLFDKRKSFPFLITKLPDIESNIPQNVFYSGTKGEFLRITLF